MPNRKEYMDFVTDWMSPLGEISARSMMGGHVLYCDGVVFALVANNVLHLKVDDTTRPRFQALGLEPFRPFPDNPGTMQYYPPPAEFFEDSDAMREWGHAAVEAGRRAKAAPRKRREASEASQTTPTPNPQSPTPGFPTPSRRPGRGKAAPPKRARPAATAPKRVGR